MLRVYIVDGAVNDGGEGSFGDEGEGWFDTPYTCIATLWGQAKSVDLHGGERCIATGVHLSVAIQADVSGSKGRRGAYRQLCHLSSHEREAAAALPAAAAAAGEAPTLVICQVSVLISQRQFLVNSTSRPPRHNPPSSCGERCRKCDYACCESVSFTVQPFRLSYQKAF